MRGRTLLLNGLRPLVNRTSYGSRTNQFEPLLMNTMLVHTSSQQQFQTSLITLAKKKTPSKIDPDRKRPAWKSYLFDLYTHLLSPKNHPVSIFFSVDNLSASEWRVLRGNMASQEGCRLTFLRSGIVPPVVQKLNQELDPLPSINYTRGSLGLLSLDTVDPPQVKSIFETFAKSLKVVKRDARKNPDAKQIEIKMAYVDGTFYDIKQLEQFSKLAGLDQLRGQIVGLISTIPRQLAGIIGAKGDEVYRTLEGRRISLEKEQSQQSQ